MKRIKFENDVLAKNILGRLRQWGYEVEESADGTVFIPEVKGNE